jgi:BirA family biotin operon repressor/biotin-[acetyl-CoA-carboxylase] ligase
MDDARDLEDRGEPDGSLVWAGYQSAGRGRHPGRVWKGEVGSSLLFTIFWNQHRFRVPGFAPSLTVGLGLCLWMESLLPSGPAAQLKWPNDVYWNDRKIAGILVRRRLGTGPGSIHAGIGVNLAPPQDTTGFRAEAGALTDAGLKLTPEHALSSLLPALALALDHPDPRSACEERLWRRDGPMALTVTGADEARTGLVRGLDAQGRLLWEGPGGLEAVSSGE